MAAITFLNQTTTQLWPFEIVERYIMDPSKAKSGYIGLEMLNEDIVGYMNIINAFYGDTNGASVVHFVLTFSPTEVSDPKSAHGFAEQIADYIGREYQVCCAVHENTENLHIHFIFNTCCYLDGHRYGETEEENQSLANFIARILHYRGGLTLDCVNVQ